VIVSGQDEVGRPAILGQELVVARASALMPREVVHWIEDVVLSTGHGTRQAEQSPVKAEE